MSAVTAEQFKQEYSGNRFLNKDDAVIQRILDRVERLYCPAEKWGLDQVDGIMLRTAHILDLEYIQSQRIASLSAKVVKGEPVDLSASSDDSNLRLTTYGQDFIELRDSLGTTLGFPFG